MSSNSEVSIFAVSIRGDGAPSHAFDLIDMQGEVVFLDAKSELESLQSSTPSPLGTLLLPENAKRCTIRMGTLALEGETSALKTPMLVLRRVESAPPPDVKRRRTETEKGSDAEEGLSSRHAAGVESMPPMLVSDAWRDGLLLGEDASSSTDTLHYEIVGTVSRRFHFKSKTTRQFNK